jgi:hypothetical protein
MIPKSTFLIFSESLEGKPPVRNGRYIISDWALKILERLIPNDLLETERQPLSEATAS